MRSDTEELSRRRVQTAQSCAEWRTRPHIARHNELTYFTQSVMAARLISPPSAVASFLSSRSHRQPTAADLAVVRRAVWRRSRAPAPFRHLGTCAWRARSTVPARCAESISERSGADLCGFKLLLSSSYCSSSIAVRAMRPRSTRRESTDVVISSRGVSSRSFCRCVGVRAHSCVARRCV